MIIYIFTQLIALGPQEAENDTFKLSISSEITCVVIQYFGCVLNISLNTRNQLRGECGREGGREWYRNKYFQGMKLSTSRNKG